MRFLFALIVLLIASNAVAAETSVKNEIRVRAQSGGDRAGATVRLKTTVNGEVLEDIEIHEESTGTPLLIEKKSEKAAENATSTTELKVELNQDLEVELPSPNGSSTSAEDDKTDKNNKEEFEPENFLARILAWLADFFSDFKFSLF